MGESHLVSIIVAIVLVVVLIVYRSPSCPDCGEKLPFPRIPKSFSQAMWGGWICKKCGIEVDGLGNKVELEYEDLRNK